MAAELTRRLWMASVTPQRADVLAQHLETKEVVAIQVKTAGRGNQFRLSKKLEEPTAVENEWVVLVSLQAKGERPVFYVMPRNVPAKSPTTCRIGFGRMSGGLGFRPTTRALPVQMIPTPESVPGSPDELQRLPSRDVPTSSEPGSLSFLSLWA